MPFEPPDFQHWQAAQGFLELGMFLEADSALDEIEPFNRVAPEVLALRVEIYRNLEKWELMREIAKRLHEFDSKQIDWLLSYAFATRRSVSLPVAKEILLASVDKFPQEAAILFSLACYDCQLNDLASAKEYLSRAFQIDKRWRIQALDEEELKPLWDSL
jgi:tetratricopeptide (TPR) repeat protein